jgi:hypothetical protein
MVSPIPQRFSEAEGSLASVAVEVVELGQHFLAAADQLGNQYLDDGIAGDAFVKPPSFLQVGLSLRVRPPALSPRARTWWSGRSISERRLRYSALILPTCRSPRKRLRSEPRIERLKALEKRMLASPDQQISLTDGAWPPALSTTRQPLVRAGSIKAYAVTRLRILTAGTACP